MIKLFSTFKNRYTRIYEWLRLLLWLVLFFIILPNAAIFILNHTRYADPCGNCLSLNGMQALVRKDDQLWLYKYTNTSKSGINNQHTETKIADLAKSYPDTFGNYTEPSTAILDDGTVVWADNNSTSTTWMLYKWKEGTTSIVKQYQRFDLDKFYKDYKDHKIGFNFAELQKETSNNYKEKFIVSTTSPNVISFIDFSVSAVDNEKPIEAIAFERRVNVDTGEEADLDRDRERLSLDMYDNFFVTYKNLYSDKKIDWTYFIDTFGGNNFAGGGITINFVGYSRDVYGTIQRIYNNSNLLFVTRKTEWHPYVCDQFLIQLPCTQVVDNSIYLDKDGGSTRIISGNENKYFSYDHSGYFVSLITTSQKNNYVVVKDNDGYYVYGVREANFSLLKDSSGEVLYLKE